MPLFLPCLIHGPLIEASSFKGVYVSPYNNQEYKRYKSPNCDVDWWEPLKNIPEFNASEVFEDYVVIHEVVGTKLGYNHEAFFKHSTTSQPPAVTPSEEVKEHIKHGLAYVSNAKNARSKEIFEENLENAIREFSLAIEKNPNYAVAYSNRAVAYMLQKKFNKAEEDLLKAKQLNPDSPTIRYNLVCLYSLTGKLDLALDELDAALEKGFNDYEALRKDPDLNNLRKHPEFRKILEKHRVFIMK